MNARKTIIPLIILSLSIAVSFGLPKPKYQSPDILSKLDIPYATGKWFGKDMNDQLDLRELRYNFISKVFTRLYVNKYEESLLFFILDAGNFHNPKVCFGSAGNKIIELPDMDFKAANHAFKAHALYAYKDGFKGTLIIYWISIDKKLVSWTKQKIIQLWYSMFNKEKIGLMVRLDIPANQKYLDSAQKLAQGFISDISANIPQEQKDFLFGK